MAGSKFFSDDDRTFKKIMQRAQSFNGHELDVGIVRGGVGKNGTPIAEYAFYNEFGTEHIPERSFMRSTVDEEQGRAQQMEARLLGDLLDGKKTTAECARIIGTFWREHIRQKIASNVPPPNAPSTLRQKKGFVTLVDTGALYRAIRYVTRRKR